MVSNISLQALTLIHFIIAHDPSTTPPRPSAGADLPASFLTPLLPLRRSSLYLTLRPRTSLSAPAPPGSYSSFVRTLSDTFFSVQVSSASSVRPYTRVRRALIGLFPNAVNALADGGRGRDCPTKASRQVTSTSSAAVLRARVP